MLSIYLLVSLSMPEAVLKDYFWQAKQLHIPIVLRGLYQDPARKSSIGSFQATTKRLFEITYDEKNGKNKNAFSDMDGILINPIWYRDFQIKAVPALVVTNNVENAQDFDVIYGNAPLSKLLILMADKSKNAEIKEFSQKKLTKTDKN